MQERSAWLYGFLGVLGFSLTLPATRVATEYFGTIVVGLGRALLAALLAAIVLFHSREQLPSKRQLKPLAFVACGVIIGFPLLTAWAMLRLPAAHGAVVLGLLPLATAGIAAIRNGERPSPLFWLCSVAGSIAVLGYAASEGFGQLEPADLALVGAVLAAAFGYAEGAKLTRELGGWQVISWVLLLAAPFLVIPVALAVPGDVLQAPWQAWLSFLYLGIVSQYLGFIAWYKGLGLGGVARISQLQYLQPFLTIFFSFLLLGETISMKTIATACLVAAIVMLGKRATVVTAVQGETNQSQHS